MIDFWFSIGSTYSYLSVMRLAQIQDETGIEFRWRPFNVRAIMIEMDNIPFAKKPAKAAYMWRDIERRGIIAGGDQLPEFRRAGDISALADIDEGGRGGGHERALLVAAPWLGLDAQG